MRKFALLFLFLAMVGVGISQDKSLVIRGRINFIDTGVVYIQSIGRNGNLYGSCIRLDSAKVVNGKFELANPNRDDLPHAYYLSYESDALSGETGMLVVERKDKFISIDAKDRYTSPRILNSKFQEELVTDYGGYYKEIFASSRLLDSSYTSNLKKYGRKIPLDIKVELEKMEFELVKRSDSLFVRYARSHKKSFVLLWKLIERYSNNGYKPEYEGIAESLSPELRQTYIYKYFLNDLKKSAPLSDNRPFPRLNLFDLNKTPFVLDLSGEREKLTLVVFWYTNCGPCLAEIPSLRDALKKYSIDDFEIVGISTDKKDRFQFITTTINTRGITWPILWDPNGVVAGKYNVLTYPTNILVNESGQIIGRDFGIAQLERLLEERRVKRSYFDLHNEPK